MKERIQENTRTGSEEEARPGLELGLGKSSG